MSSQNPLNFKAGLVSRSNRVSRQRSDVHVSSLTHKLFPISANDLARPMGMLMKAGSGQELVLVAHVMVGLELKFGCGIQLMAVELVFYAPVKS